MVRMDFVRSWLYNLQDRDAVVVELLHLLVPTGCGERRRVAPRIVVESEEVAADGIGSAVHVRSHFIAVRLDISGRVTDRDLAESTSINVGLDIASDSLDVGSAVCGGIIVDNLIGGEEEERVVVLGELLDRRENALKVDLVIRWLRVGSVNRVLGSIDVESKVDASSGLDALVFILQLQTRVSIPERSCTRRGWQCCQWCTHEQC
jgi:hypothetical protein